VTARFEDPGLRTVSLAAIGSIDSFRGRSLAMILGMVPLAKSRAGPPRRAGPGGAIVPLVIPTTGRVRVEHYCWSTRVVLPERTAGRGPWPNPRSRR